MIHLGDITKLNGAEIPAVDVICGGSPCQDLSTAGKRAGLEGERSGLFMEQIRIVKEMRENDRRKGRTNCNIRPKWLVWENVPGAFSSGKPKGSDFQAVLTEIVRIVKPDAPDVPLPTRGGGEKQDVSWVTETTDALFQSRTEFTTHSFGVSPSEENGSRLSQILEVSPPPKYVLSAAACAGILRRAEKRGKKLPEILEKALREQSASIENEAEL